MAELAPGQTLGVIEASVPEHRAEPFVYARVTLSFTAWTGRVSAGTQRVIDAVTAAQACGIDLRELARTEALVLTIHRPRVCAFAGFRQLGLGERTRRVLAVA